MLALAAGAALGAIWMHRLVDAARGMPRVPDIAAPAWEPPAGTDWPRLSVIVPARNEAEHIEAALRSLLGVDYPGLEIIAVDDRSSDATGEIMERLAGASGGRLRVLRVRELPERWLGKVHAMWLGARQASGEWLLFTDADVIFRQDSLQRALHYAGASGADHLVVFPTVDMRTPGERMMIAFFQLLFSFGHRPWKTADPKAKDHMGVGAFNLVRREAYEAVGTYEALRMEVLDDMRLGKLIKDKGRAQRNVFGRDLVVVRWARGARGVVHNLTKNMFALMRFRWELAVAGAVLLALLNLGPWAGLALAHGWARAGFAVAVAAILGLYAGMATRSRVPFYYFLTHPVATVIFDYIVLRSMAHALLHGGVVWRGTKYRLEELRGGLTPG
jgi:glycosyltransferase involved in cell wall biosynthesis